jgi:Protein of unknown function (DUF3788)
MPLSAFEDRNIPPDEHALAATLGRVSSLWRDLAERLQADHGPLREEWQFAGARFGWSFRLKEPKRVLVYLTPCRGHFLASFALGERACAEARMAGLPASVLALIDAAPRYAEGRGVRIPVRRKSDVEAVRKLAAIKHSS